MGIKSAIFLIAVFSVAVELYCFSSDSTEIILANFLWQISFPLKV